jgi:hypothetical protein
MDLCRGKKVGPFLSTMKGLWIALEDVHDTGQVETEHNLRMSDYHTYFVGSHRWGFADSIPDVNSQQRHSGTFRFSPDV